MVVFRICVGTQQKQIDACHWKSIIGHSFCVVGVKGPWPVSVIYSFIVVCVSVCFCIFTVWKVLGLCMWFCPSVLDGWVCVGIVVVLPFSWPVHGVVGNCSLYGVGNLYSCCLG